ncbi:riboflavin synthase subunit alpha [Vulcanimicrobium alpinum]|uniref:Riboflavin synthase n=1 Tax=Vulcanimicrobium alpinum TaxID=3016050 RepID=A0AAN1XV36_UNVUL|nr:riboflavin synthase [Vulcanimicrobium alpinum]BDE05944.1 riboflavin synthase subunit alpha [Vulcanimicrobium alpinum]
MFSGLIVHDGRVVSVTGTRDDGLTLVVESPSAIADGVALGDSIAINGVCLTVVGFDERTMRFDVVPETVDRTGFDALRPGDRVNLELSLRLGDRLGGHLVYGHVDGNAQILAKETEGQGYRLHVALPGALAAYIVEKGYVAVDGVSLTVASTTQDAFTIALIPETARRTTLGTKGAGDRVNLEIDPVARYAQGAIAAYARR